MSWTRGKDGPGEGARTGRTRKIWPRTRWMTPDIVWAKGGLSDVVRD